MFDLVDAPKLRPHTNGLLTHGNVVTNTGGKWENGVTFTPTGCSVIHAHDALCWISGDAVKTVQGCVPAVEFKPYTIELTLEWHQSDRGFDVEKYLGEMMDVGTGAVLERLQEFGVSAAGIDPDDPITVPPLGSTNLYWGAIVGRAGSQPNPLLDDGQLLGDDTDPRKALGLLEAKMLDASDHIGGAGTIYMGPYAANQLWGSFAQIDGHLVTATTGSKVIVGNYSQNTIYGHVGDVDVYVSEPVPTSVASRGDNVGIAQAERLVLVAWNPCATFKHTLGGEI